MKRTIKRSINYNDLSVKECFDLFVEEKEAINVVEKTINNYKSSLTKFLEANKLTEESPISAIEQSMVFRWIDNMLHNEGLATASVNHYLRDFRSFIYWCMNHDYYAQQYKIKNVKGQEEKLKLYDEEELKVLLEKPKNRDSYVIWRSWAIVNFILATGARCSTISNIKLSDLNFTRREIIYSHTKNKKAQTVPMSDSLETVLREFIRIWRNNVIDGYLFCDIGEQQASTDALKHAHFRYCKDRECQHTSLHSLRHNFAKGFIQNNGNPLVLKNILGHSTLAMTNHYVALFTEDIKEGYSDYSPLDTLKKNKKRTNKMVKN